MKQKNVRTLIGMVMGLALTMALVPKPVEGHCQIPCGIYGDEMRFQMLEEHITTIQKSMDSIVELSADPGKNANQLIRWVVNKDTHADEMASIVTQYFLQQRLKLDDPQWAAKVKPCHEILFYAMRTKQTTDLANVEKLRAAVAAFKAVYFTKEQAEHLEESHSSEHAR
ncbi:MAG: superoxide dismutase, Ni [Acidobacteria bacterium]|jgi:nickel superoxide dismutase|nr:superoxide dismutase, Ni [Acidobacteriota bacterium]